MKLFGTVGKISAFQTQNIDVAQSRKSFTQQEINFDRLWLK